MPLQPDYSWKQTEERVMLDLNLHRRSPKDVSVDIASQYVKATYPPYHLELFLLHAVDVAACSYRVANGRVNILLTKAESGSWEALNRTLSRDAAAAERQAALQQLHTLLQQKESSAKAERVSSERRSVSHQVRLDEELRVKDKHRLENIVKDFFRQNDSKEEEGLLTRHVSSPDDDQQVTEVDRESVRASSVSSTNSTNESGSRRLSSDSHWSSSESRSKDDSVQNENCEMTSKKKGSSNSKGWRVSEDREYDGDEEDHDTSEEDALPQLLSEVSLRGGRKSRRQRRGGGRSSPRLVADEDLHHDLSPGECCLCVCTMTSVLVSVVCVCTTTSPLVSVVCVSAPRPLPWSVLFVCLHHDLSPEKPHSSPPEPASSLRPTAKKTRLSNSKTSVGIRPSRHVYVSYTSRPDRLPARSSRDGNGATLAGGADEGATEQRIIAKANALFESGLYNECVDEYTALLERCGDSVRAYSNRAAAHLASGHPRLALQGANKALSMLGPPSPSTNQSRLLCLSRRGAALTALGHLSEALRDYDEALALQPDHAGLIKDRANIMKALDTSEGSSFLETEEEEVVDHSNPDVG
ncbi:CS domain [Trinorchestia longiramus]|nr:CS domain [Trinorchestia longiramus]